MNIAVILSGGQGNRAGTAIPKQYVEVCEKPMVRFCMETIFSHEAVDAVQLVVDEKWREYVLSHVFQVEKQFAAEGKFRGFTMPGINRQMSIYYALVDLKKYALDNDTVIIHDAARPFVSAAQISQCLADMEGYEGVIPVLPVKDTIYMGDGKRICSLLDRGCIYAGQAPELFRLGKYYEANRMLLPDKILSINGSTEPAVLSGMDIRLSEGDERNFKITTERDMELFSRMIKES